MGRVAAGIRALLLRPSGPVMRLFCCSALRPDGSALAISRYAPRLFHVDHPAKAMAAPSHHVALLMAGTSLQRCWQPVPFYLGGSATSNEPIVLFEFGKSDFPIRDRRDL